MPNTTKTRATKEVMNTAKTSVGISMTMMKRRTMTIMILTMAITGLKVALAVVQAPEGSRPSDHRQDIGERMWYGEGGRLTKGRGRRADGPVSGEGGG